MKNILTPSRGLSVFLLALIAVGCGGSPTAPSATPSPSGSPALAPSPSPTPSSTTWNGTVINTVTGAPVSGFTAVRNGSRVTISAPGHVTRETAANASRVDLFPEAGFDLTFYRQLARGALDGFMDVLLVLPSAPAFYIEVEGTGGFSASLAARLEAVTRRTVPLITGGRFQVSRWETGSTRREPEAGWIVIQREEVDQRTCGLANVGAVAGRIRLSSDPGCRPEATLAHELGHAFGFSHVDRVGSMMYPYELGTGSATDAPTEVDRHHMSLMYARPRGNRDLDVDP